MRKKSRFIVGIAITFLARAAKSQEEEKNGVISFDLEPSASLHHKDFMKGHRRLESTNEDAQDFFFHPYTNGVYSSLVEQKNCSGNNSSSTEIICSSLMQEHNKRVREFNSHRHLSRHEIFQLQRHENEIENDTSEHSEIKLHRFLQQNTNLRGGLPPLLNEINDQLVGDLYNDFQSAPLSQGYGTHYATVWVGTPTPQRKTLIVDTGSHHTAWPCKGCQDCGEDHHTDSYFDPDQSKTFIALQCHECRYEARCEAMNEKQLDSKNSCMVRQAYTEGSSWTAYQARDMVFCGGRDVFSAADPVDQRYAVPFMFGCQMSSNGLFHSQLADGIMGLSQHEAVLPRVMYAQGKLQNRMFSLCFRKEVMVSKKGVSAGVLTFGGIDKRLDSSPRVWAKNMARTGWYTVFVKNVFLHKGNDLSNVMKVPINTYDVNSDKGVIIDSGTTDSYLHTSLKQPFNKIWKELTGKSYSNSPVRLTREQLLSLPTINIQIMAYNNEPDVDLSSSGNTVGLVGSLDSDSPTDVLLSIPATHYMEYSPSKDVYTPRFYFTESKGGVIGANSLQGHDILFDWENGRIGFAESDCKLVDTNSEGEGLASEGAEAKGDDCILQPSVTSKSCIDTVDASLCTADDQELVLVGMKTLTSVVEYPGTTGGYSCEDVARRNMFHIGVEGDLPDVHCTQSGVCTGTQRCELPCKDLQDSKLMIVSEAEKPRPKCGEGSWGVCLESCSQSKVTSILMSDGECHEVEDERLERSCHIDYCGIQDPCVIPFVVHVILAFRGINNNNWNKAAESSVIEAFASSVKNSRGNAVFEPTDVELLMISPWSEEIPNTNESSTGGGTTQVSGMKAVIEVHIHNPNAFQHVPNEGGMGSTDIQQKVSAMIGRKDKASQEDSGCRSSDLFELAQKAHEIHNVLGQNNFMKQMVHSLQTTNADDPSSIWLPLVTNQEYIDESVVVSSWTIKMSIGGGSIYDHKLDPFPGAINYVQVSPAYFGYPQLTLLSALILIVIAYKIFVRNNKHKEKDLGTFNFIFTSATFFPKPFEMVRRKFGTIGLTNKKVSRETGGGGFQAVETNSNGKEHSSFIKSSNCRSRLNDIITN